MVVSKRIQVNCSEWNEEIDPEDFKDWISEKEKEVLEKEIGWDA